MKFLIDTTLVIRNTTATVSLILVLLTTFLGMLMSNSEIKTVGITVVVLLIISSLFALINKILISNKVGVK